ncbi:glycosyl transferase [Coemansia erecta]|nr:glycosyl transferase [Coemansia sp. RSA 2618]KAJ2823599.1 glycosyl transferase [Coemansia erecta]
MLDTAELSLLVVGTSIKLLLWPAYHSTDFEVHRNWLAITASLPPSQWYYEDRSEWTLDYPPLFAWFEWMMSHLARMWDPRIVDIDNLGYAADSCVMFQRLTVIVSELVLFMALRRVVRIRGSTVQGKVAMAAVFLSPGFLFVDHVHFQYNGFLLGILVYSISLVLEGRDLLAGTVFAVLLCFKHIFMYIAPAYFVYLLRNYCAVWQGRQSGLDLGASAARLLKLGAAVVAVFAAAFGPFAAMGQLPQVLGRLFPFKRGLCHAFWAPNFWALYVFTDRVLAVVSRIFALSVADVSQLESSTRGRVGDTRFAVLPDVPPISTFFDTLVAMTPAFVVLLRRRAGPVQFVQAVVLCAYASFLFGWHVHEKAVILILVPLGVLVDAPSRRVLRMHAVVSVAGLFSLLPLLFGVQELPLKACILLIWVLCTLNLLRADGVSAWACLTRIERAYIAGHIPLFVATELVPGFVFGRLQFVPLALVSAYTALGICYSWVGLAHAFITEP